MGLGENEKRESDLLSDSLFLIHFLIFAPRLNILGIEDQL